MSNAVFAPRHVESLTHTTTTPLAHTTTHTIPATVARHEQSSRTSFRTLYTLQTSPAHANLNAQTASQKIGQARHARSEQHSPHPSHARTTANTITTNTTTPVIRVVRATDLSTATIHHPAPIQTSTFASWTGALAGEHFGFSRREKITGGIAAASVWVAFLVLALL